MENASSKIALLLLVAVALLFAGCATPLNTAARNGDMKEAERLIAAGADVNAKSVGGVTPLHLAACLGGKEVAELLISKGADVNAKNDHGWTPLYYVVMGPNGNKEVNKEVVELLLSKGADVNAKTNEGKTPLSIAKEKGHTSVVSLLEKAKLKAEKEPSSPAEEAAFTEAARSYRAATVKPTLPEEAHKFKVQAEFAVSKKDFERAIKLYKEALDMAPWWPEGHFNRALILGELSRYRDAMKEMKKYLTLVPDAPNARAAQDKIYQWEGELR